MTETTFPEQNKLAYTYDNNSNVLTTSAKAKPGAPALPDLVTNTVYDPTFNKPVQVTGPRGLVATLAAARRRRTSQSNGRSAILCTPAAQKSAVSASRNVRGVPRYKLVALSPPAQ